MSFKIEIAGDLPEVIDDLESILKGLKSLKNGKPTKKKTKRKPKAAKPAPETVEPLPEAFEMSADAFQGAVASNIELHGTEAVQETFREKGFRKVTDVPADRYHELLQDLEELKDED